MKPPFDPLTAGWVLCACRCHQAEFATIGHWHTGCPFCDGLGIVVGPPEDGLEIARMFAGRTDLGPIAPGSYGLTLLRHANAYKRP